MCFRIDIARKDRVTITLIIARNSINFAFESPNEEESFRVISAFSKLTNTYSKIRSIVRGEDPEHIKRHHISDEEITVPHMHFFHAEDITPINLIELFEYILHKQQDSQELWITPNTATTLTDAFTEFYKSFQGSETQRQYLEETQLRADEMLRLADKFAHDPLGELANSDILELQKHGIPLPKKTTLPSFPAIDKIFLETFFKGTNVIVISQKKEQTENKIPKNHPLATGMAKLLQKNPQNLTSNKKKLIQPQETSEITKNHPFAIGMAKFFKSSAKEESKTAISKSPAMK